MIIEILLLGTLLAFYPVFRMKGKSRFMSFILGVIVATVLTAVLGSIIVCSDKFPPTVTKDKEKVTYSYPQLGGFIEISYSEPLEKNEGVTENN